MLYQVIPPNPVKFKPLEVSSVLPKIERQSVECLKEIQNIPALFEMKYNRLPSMKLQSFKTIGNKIATNKPSDEIENAVWNSLCTRATKKTGKRFLFNFKRNPSEC